MHYINRMDVTNLAVSSSSKVTALLGPTNTGKTWKAIDRMLGYQTGMIGFPLRLLARENYDRVVRMKGAGAVALITGEEKILPPRARYFLCTVEAMPVGKEFDFVAIDEIQLCADAERGHIFTDRLLRTRGRAETMFLGADTMAPLIRSLVPGAEFESRPRLSKLSYAGSKKLTRLPKRSAVVAFSINDVYNIAELVRRQRGGTAVVLGALSPRTRNAQVEMYQNGEVDFLVATDAIGMGLNMDIHHVAFAALRKYDGARLRDLTKQEIAQVAGRAGRHMRDGTFGVTGALKSIDAETIEAVENHLFEPVRQACWRNAALDFSSPKMLLNSLERPSGRPALIRGRPADDQVALASLLRREDVQNVAATPDAVRLLWEACQIPDFRKTMSESHHTLVADIYQRLLEGPLPEDYVARHIERLGGTEGDVDALMARIAHVRTWTYISHHADWLKNAAHWQEKARALEDRLSDVLHEALTRRFVDQRAAVLMRSLEEQRDLLAGVKKDGEVVVEGHPVGQLQGFRFIPDVQSTGPDYKPVMTAARNALKPEIQRRMNAMLNAESKQFTLKDDGRIFYQADKTNPLPGAPLAAVRKGPSVMRPDVDLPESDLLEGKDRDAVTEKLRSWLHAHIDTVLEPLKNLENDEGLGGPARGICFQVHEALGILPRHVVEPLIAELDPEGRASLRERKVRLGPVLVFIPALNKPAGVRLRALLWSLWNDKPLPAPVPKDGIVSYTVEAGNVDHRFQRAIGYPVYGPRAIRIDMLDRVISAVYDSADKGVFKASHKMAEWLGSSIPDLYAVLEAMGHRKIHDPAEDAAKEDAAKPESEAAPESADAPAPKQPGDIDLQPEATAEIAEGVETPVVAPEQQTETEAAAEEKPEGEPAKPAEQKRPELATFRLKKGKASDRPKPPFGKLDKPRGKKPEGKPEFREDRKPRHGKPKRPERGERPERVMSAGPKMKPEDSPFAVLQQLKNNNEKK